jgi:hypothetical protein
MNSPINQTKKLVRKVVIALNLCPFAKIPFKNKQIGFADCKEVDAKSMLNFFIDELALLELNHRADLSTSLVIYPNDKRSFETFNQFSQKCDDYLAAANLTDIFQVVVFHPQFRFKRSKKNDRANLVGQSPYPMLHILRNIEIEEAQKSYLGVEEIPFRNQKKILALSSKKWKDAVKYKNRSKEKL